MTQVRKLWPLLTATHRYDKSLSTWQRGQGQMIEAPILAYLIETVQGRILYDVGCDHRKISDPVARAQHYKPNDFAFGAPEMTEEQRIPAHLARLGLTPADVDVIFIGHLHFDHAGGLKELRRCGCGAEIHVQRAEAEAARDDPVVFPDDLLAGDAADLQENLDDEVAPGYCWQGRVDEAVSSIRKLKKLAAETQATLWPNHDMAFYRDLRPFPEPYV